MQKFGIGMPYGSITQKQTPVQKQTTTPIQKPTSDKLTPEDEKAFLEGFNQYRDRNHTYLQNKYLKENIEDGASMLREPLGRFGIAAKGMPDVVDANGKPSVNYILGLDTKYIDIGGSALGAKIGATVFGAIGGVASGGVLAAPLAVLGGVVGGFIGGIWGEKIFEGTYDALYDLTT